MRKLRIGLVGFGFMGKTHLWAVENLPFFYRMGDAPNALPCTAEVVAVCLSHRAMQNPEAALAEVARYGIPRIATEEELIADPEIDVIDICTPNPCHYDTARRAILAGKHVLCEKPLCDTWAHAEELAALAREHGVICATVFNNRHLAPVMRARQIIDEGRLGEILSFDFSYRHNSCIDPDRRAGWKQMADFGGGTLADLGPHAIDLCHYLCGELSWVTAHAQIAFPTHKTADGGQWTTDADEAFYMLCGTAGGACGSITVSKLVQGANDELTFAVNGTRGSLSFSLMDPNFLNFYDATAEGSPMGGVRGYTRIECVGRYPAPASGFPTVKAPVGWLRGHIGSMASYLTAVATGTPTSPSFDDGAYVQRVIEAARESAATGREVRLC